MLTLFFFLLRDWFRARFVLACPPPSTLGPGPSQRSKFSRTRKFYLWFKINEFRTVLFSLAAAQRLASPLLSSGRSLVYFPTDDVGHAKRSRVHRPGIDPTSAGCSPDSIEWIGISDGRSFYGMRFTESRRGQDYAKLRLVLSRRRGQARGLHANEQSTRASFHRKESTSLWHARIAHVLAVERVQEIL